LALMGYRQREIEMKTVVKGARRMADVDRLLAPLLIKRRRIIIGKSEDIYFNPPKGAKADFVRLRRANKDGKATLTLKWTDKQDNFNRVERDLHVPQFSKAMNVMTDLFGAPAGAVNKSYVVYFMGSRHDDESSTTISIYKIINDPRVFLEVEAKSEAKVHYWMKRIARALPFDLVREKRSLFQIFVKKG
jgi:adenylate cyclase class IV